MQYRLKLKPAELKKGNKYKVISITDITLHTSNKQPTVSLGRKIKKSFTSKNPGRIYGSIKEPSPPSKDKMFVLTALRNDPEFIKMVQEEEKKGYKILIALPKTGIPVLAGKDTIDFINSKNGKRIIRGLEKK